MHAIEFLKQEPDRECRPVYAVYGDETYLRREVAHQIVRQALGPEADELAVVRFPGEKTPLADVLDELRTLPFLSRRRVVIVEDADAFVTAHRAELEAYVARPSATGVLVLAVKTWMATTKLAKLVQQTGVAVECKTPRADGLVRWLVEMAKHRFDATLTGPAAHLLVELVGPELSLLASEVEKLATYVGEKLTIHREDVARMVGAGRIETIWKTIEAATTGKTAEALGDIDRLLATGESPVGYLGAITYTLRRIYHAGQMRIAGRDLEQACQEADIRPYMVKMTAEQHKHLGRQRVNRLPAMLLQADLDLKGSSSLSPQAVLERLLIELARPRAEVER